MFVGNSSAYITFGTDTENNPFAYPLTASFLCNCHCHSILTVSGRSRMPEKTSESNLADILSRRFPEPTTKCQTKMQSLGPLDSTPSEKGETKPMEGALQRRNVQRCFSPRPGNVLTIARAEPKASGGQEVMQQQRCCRPRFIDSNVHPAEAGNGL